MVGRIIGFVAFLMCAIPLAIVSKYDKDGLDPINFWSGDTTLKDKVKDVPSYNKEMSLLYKRCALVLLLSGIANLFYTPIGIAMIVFSCTLGPYIVYRCYKKILNQYS